jgi:hypothetical protein
MNYVNGKPMSIQSMANVFVRKCEFYCKALESQKIEVCSKEDLKLRKEMVKIKSAFETKIAKMSKLLGFKQIPKSVWVSTRERVNSAEVYTKMIQVKCKNLDRIHA